MKADDVLGLMGDAATEGSVITNNWCTTTRISSTTTMRRTTDAYALGRRSL